jgi:hypothetical protein
MRKVIETFGEDRGVCGSVFLNLDGLNIIKRKDKKQDKMSIERAVAINDDLINSQK